VESGSVIEIYARYFANANLLVVRLFEFGSYLQLCRRVLKLGPPEIVGLDGKCLVQAGPEFGRLSLFRKRTMRL